MSRPARALSFLAITLTFAMLAANAAPGRAALSQTAVRTVTVDAGANVFAAGVGGLKANGGGKKPVIVAFEPFKRQVLLFTSVLDKVSCCSGGNTFNGPEGGTNAGGSTDILSSGGISGIIDHNRTMFLVGVFVGSPGPTPPGPERKDVTYDSGKSDVYPKLDQTFYIGNGKVLVGGSYQRIHVPDGANQLVLGFVDGFSFHGAPGAYDDNLGQLTVKFRLTPTQT
jgi:hypothetical protein